jgi:hypothetical protein
MNMASKMYFVFLALFVGSAIADCPLGYQHMTSVNCGVVAGKKAKLITCSSFHNKTIPGHVCTSPSFSWMYAHCETLFGKGKTFNPVWERTESSCYPDDTNTQYWLDYNNYTLTGEFCVNFPKVKRTNNFQFERGNLLYWTAHPSVSVVTQEDGITPPDATFSKFMAKLHTSGYDVVTLFRDDFFVPGCAKSIQFHYNFLTLEYGASYYNDFMTIVIEDENGQLLKQVVVDQMGIQDKPGTPGGNWLHASGWRKVWFSIVGLPLDQILRLKVFVDVRNVGDGSFDSTVLLDRLKFNL